MKLKTLMAAGLTAVALSSAIAVPASYARGYDDRSERSERSERRSTMSRAEARRALREYFERRDQRVRIGRTWTNGRKMYAKVKTLQGYPLGTYSVDLRSGRIRRESRGR